MREILFRGKVADEPDEWVYGYLLTHNRIQQIEEPKYIGNCGIGMFSVIPETICQFTGLKDKNGKMVFEGDMLKSYYDKPGIVKWNNEIGAFQVKGIPSQTMKRCYQMEVIGNVFDEKE